MNGHLSRRSRAIVALLLFVLLASPSCAGSSVTGSGEGKPESTETTFGSKDRAEETRPEIAGSEVRDPVETVEAVLPEDVLSDKQLEHQETPKYEDWHNQSDAQPDKLVSTDSSVGTIPAVKPFNLGRDPGGPGDRTLYLTVPKLGLKRIPVFDEVSEETLKESVVHVPVTGFPWQEGANTYIAGHRIGYPGTGSSYVFFHLDWLTEGDEILLRDAEGKDYQYRVTEKVRVSPENVEVMEPMEGESLVSLQTCTLPDYKKRLIVHGELVRTSA